MTRALPLLPVAEREARLRRAVEAHADAVWRFVRRMGVNEADAEDAVQQVLVVFARKLDVVDAEAELGFLLGTALRVARDRRRSYARGREVPGDEVIAREVSPSPSQDEALDAQRARRVLDELLAQLPDDLRAVLVMCDLEEVTMSEAAQALEIPAGTVASRLRRAREELGVLVADARRRQGDAT